MLSRLFRTFFILFLTELPGSARLKPLLNTWKPSEDGYTCPGGRCQGNRDAARFSGLPWTEAGLQSAPMRAKKQS